MKGRFEGQNSGAPIGFVLWGVSLAQEVRPSCSFGEIWKAKGSSSPGHDIGKGQGCSNAALHGGAGLHRSIPAGKVGAVVERYPGKFTPPEPAEMGDIGDGVFVASEPLVSGKMRVDHVGQAVSLALVPGHGRSVGLGGKLLPKAGLPKGRPYSRHLHHQPFEGAGPRAGIGRQELPGLLGKMNQDGPRLREHEVAVDQQRNLGIGVQRDIGGRLLFALPDVDGMQVVRQAQFLECHGHLDGVRGGEGINGQHGKGPSVQGFEGGDDGVRFQPDAVVGLDWTCNGFVPVT